MADVDDMLDCWCNPSASMQGGPLIGLRREKARMK